MSTHSKILAISTHTAELCAQQSLLYAAGFQLVTATNVTVALSVIRAMQVMGVIICRSSWSEEEREKIAAEIGALSPELAILRDVRPQARPVPATATDEKP
jgi:hypothetical protein